MFAGLILVTCGAAGMTLFEPGARRFAFPRSGEVRDVTGAGDTVTATVALTLAAGARLEQAARLASARPGSWSARPAPPSSRPWSWPGRSGPTGLEASDMFVTKSAPNGQQAS